MGEHKLDRRVFDSKQTEVAAQLLMLEGKILRLQFHVALDHLDMTPAQAIELGKLLMNHGALMLV